MWIVSSVTDIRCMFVKAKSFNQSLNSWDVSSVTDMSNVFHDALSFDKSNALWYAYTS